jgi:hypothetical protein
MKEGIQACSVGSGSARAEKSKAGVLKPGWWLPKIAEGQWFGTRTAVSLAHSGLETFVSGSRHKYP